MRPDSGQVFIDGQDVTDWTEAEFQAVRKKVSMVFQSGALFDSLTVAENIAFPLEGQANLRRTKSMTTLRNWPRLWRSMNFLIELPGELSTGARRAVAIARSLAQNPEAILYDEPTTMVDPIMAAHMGDLILRLKESFHKTSIVVTHDTHLAKKLADSVVFLQDGKVSFFGTWKKFESSNDRFPPQFPRAQDQVDSRHGRHPVSQSERPLLADPIKQLRKEMGFWDVLFFNIATVLGPRWVAAAAHNGTSSISLWVLAALFFFVPTALVINELSSRFPNEGGLYVWSKEAFGDFHGFVAGWTYWIYTVFYFPGLLLASTAMSALRQRSAAAPHWRRTAHFCWRDHSALLAVAVVLNIIGLNIGKWLQNAGGVSTYIPLLMLVVIGRFVYLRHGSVTHFTLAQHAAALEFRHRKFLVADRFCLYRTGTGLRYER